MQLSMFLSEERPAKVFRSQDFAKEWLIRGVTSRWSILQLLSAIAPSGSFGRTCPVSCHQERDGTLVPSSGAWGNSGMGSPTECLTLSTCEWTALPEQFPSDDGVCSLSDILQIGDVPHRFYLSAKACAGIIRRAERRGKPLPGHLLAALQLVAASAPTSTATVD